MSTLTPTDAPAPGRLPLAFRSLLALLVAVATLVPLAALADQGDGGLGTTEADGATAPQTSLLPASVATTTSAPAPDGLSEGTAAASCWEIVQRDASAEDGVYWLVTPELGAPQQFYCDQTTDGGGWVLVGRGREYWTQSNDGRLTPADVAHTPTGPGAFAPAQLPADTVDGLLNDGEVDELSDGVRLRRALTTDGSDWQEVSFHYGTPRDDWSWQFTGLQSVNSWSMDSSSGSGGTTGSFGADSSYRRVDTNVDRNRGWSRGFSYGSGARGSSSPTSYVWAPSSNSGYPRPFTQVFLRPRLMSESIFTAVPDTGLPASTQVATAQSYPLPTPWGVSGLGAAGGGELNTEVAAFAESNGVMYVGGNFRYVQRDAGGNDRVEQSYLAAFDISTGEWIPAFRPDFDNQVKSIVVLPDGRLAVGGAFSTVDGQPSPAFAVLDPLSGDRDASVTTRILNYTGGVPPLIRSMDVQDGYLYLGGRFTHITGGGVTSEVYRRNIGRLDIATLAPGADWDPMLDGTVVSLDASEQGDRVYAAGYFGLSQWTEPTIRAGAFTADDATVVPWSVDFSNTSGGRVGYQQAVEEVGDRVWLGGSEHMLFSYDRTTMQELSTNITQNGGDFQALAAYGEDGVAAGCHCSENVYEGARDWPGISGFSRVEHIDQVGIWRASDGAYVPEHSPQVSLRSGYGAWAIEGASDGSLWVGGDYTYARTPDTRNQWTGAFIRFAPTDSEAPAVPQGLTAAAAEGVDQLNWSPVADATYEVLREDRVVATTDGASLQLPRLYDGARYFVRAVDAAGNRSATSPVVVPEAVDPGTFPVTAIAAGADWSYYYEAAAPAGDWTGPGFDDSSWNSGTAPLGWGQDEISTPLSADGTAPLTAYFRHAFTIEDATQIAALEIATRADDGIAIYVNGTEVDRANLPDGTIGHGTYATAAPNAATPITLSVPGNQLVTGENVITAEVHLNYRSTPTLSHELEAQLIPGEQPDPEPDPEPEPEPGQVIAAGADWSYYYEAAAPAGDWTGPGFDDSSWNSGTAPLGWGQDEISTPLSADGTAPLTAYFRHAFTIEDATQIAALEIATRADDGIAIYVNGTEVDRANLPDGTIGHGTYATAAPNAATPITLSVPGNLLVTGENVITAEVHLNYRSTPTLSHELTAEVIDGAQPDGPPQVLAAVEPQDGEEELGTMATPEGPEADEPDSEKPGEADPGTTEPDTADVDKTESTDPEGTEPADTEPSRSEAADAAGTESTCTAVPSAEEEPRTEAPEAATEEEEEALDPDEVIPMGSEWAFDCDADEDTGWTSPELDDSTWQRGAAPLGWGAEESQLGTVLRTGHGDPLSARYRHTLEIDDLDGVQALLLTLPASAGLAVHVNGLEVEPPEELKTDDESVLGAVEETVTLTIPMDMLKLGENTLAVGMLPGEAPQAGSIFDAHGVLALDRP